MMITNEIKNKVNALKVEQGLYNATVHMNKVLYGQVNLNKLLVELKELTELIGTDAYHELPLTVALLVDKRIDELNSEYDKVIDYIDYQYGYLMSYIN